MKNVLTAIDGRDLMLAAGLTLLAFGLWPSPTAFIVPGMILTGVAIFGVRG